MRNAILLLVATLIINACSIDIPKGSSLRYQNDDIGVRAYFNDYWYIYTNANNTAPAFAKHFPDDKDKNQSPLFFGVYKNSQLFTRLSVEAYEGSTTDYVRLLSKVLSKKGLKLISVKEAITNGTFEIEYSNDSKAVRFRERISRTQDNYIVRLAFWGPLAYLPYYDPFIDREFGQVALYKKRNKGYGWVKDWAKLEDCLAEDDLKGVTLAPSPVDKSKPLTCENPSSSWLYKVAGKTSNVYLFGSMHAGDKSFYPLHKTIEDSFQASDYLVLEVTPNWDDYIKVQHVISTRARTEVGETISDMVSAPTVAQLKKQLTDMGLPNEDFMKFKPWFLSLTMSDLHMSSAGYVSKHGIERYLLKQKPKAMKLLQLETLPEQFSILEHLNSEAQLVSTLNGFEGGPEQVQSLVNQWRCADKQFLTPQFEEKNNASNLFADDFDFIHQKMLIERNVGMADKINGYLNDGKGDYFVTIGAAHLVGDGSVIELLEQQQHVVHNIALN